jgi:ribosomal protein S18 acetylase RimI-like enzyme
MIQIEKPDINCAEELFMLAKKTFLQSHGHSAPEGDILNYINRHFNLESFKKELSDPSNLYHTLSSNDRIVGYSKIKLDQGIPALGESNITKLERIYLLDEAHGSGLGRNLFNFNIELAKQNKQAGIWLYTWVENHRAIAFYEKMGFAIIGSHNFKISETHANPNHQMFLAF